MNADHRWMRRALALAAKAWGRTSPNPMVGAVVVRGDRVVGEGWHQRAGGPHAEIHALRAAGDAARGATLYVTLEPCSTRGRTPPCIGAVLRAGLQRVVIATIDPNPRHQGRGVAQLRAAGIEVTMGVEAARATVLNEAFFCWIRHGRPFVTLKLAMTADGKLATAGGQSQWLTGPVARRQVQRLRQGADAILVGAETIRRDNPQLLVRTPRDWPRQPLRLVASRSGDLGPSPQVLTDGAPTRLLRAADAAEWQAHLQALGREQITALLVEGGGDLAADLLRAGVVDKLLLFIAPALLGGRGSRPVIGGADPPDLTHLMPLHDATVRRCGADFLLTGYLNDVHRIG